MKKYWSIFQVNYTQSCPQAISLAWIYERMSETSLQGIMGIQGLMGKIQ